MVYTVTFNPSLDYIVSLDNFNEGGVNRTTGEIIYPGGKGVNVSLVLNNLGIENTVLGFVAGFTGIEIEQRLEKMGCRTDFIHVENGISRINVKIRAEKESEINGRGPDVDETDIQQLINKLNSLKAGDVLVLAGSIPDTLPESVYMDILRELVDKNIKVVVDATGELLVNVLGYKPFMIKPNNHELEEIFRIEINTEEEIIKYGKKLQEMGARNVLISRAGDGAILICEDGRVITSPAAKGKVVNSVGAGDSMVAGFIAGYLEQEDYEYALKVGIATGSASAFSEQLATRVEMERILHCIM